MVWFSAVGSGIDASEPRPDAGFRQAPGRWAAPLCREPEGVPQEIPIIFSSFCFGWLRDLAEHGIGGNQGGPPSR